jgi:hypothetical protein
MISTTWLDLAHTIALGFVMAGASVALGALMSYLIHKDRS